MNLCSNTKFYPVITWLEYSGACATWKILDNKYLTQQDVDRLFIAVNYDENDLDDNDDNSLCRYEFTEIAARIGREKYFNKGLTDSIHEGTRRFIEDYLIPNTCEKMPWQPFRKDRLWNLDVDDLFKANRANMDKLYKLGKTGDHTKDLNAFELADAIFLLEMSGYRGVNNLDNIGLAYSLSKMTIINEMEDFDSYNNLKKVEFYEFLGRFAELSYEGDIPLVQKLGRLLTIVFEKCINSKIIFPDFEKDIETDSDFDDDIVEKVKNEILDSYTR